MTFKIIKDVTPKKNPGRIKRLIIEVPANEELLSIDPDKYYELGEPMNDIVLGEYISQSSRVVWDSIEQHWIRA